MAAVIKKVELRSPFFGKIHKGDSILSVNGHTVTDVFDYNFYISDEGDSLFTFLTEKGTVDLTLPRGREAGLRFDTYLMDREHSCKNKCIFCFIDQLPRGMRDTLYFKDDDSRLSFLFGNYITLTNLKDEDVRRIGEMHISPVNISVHATDPEVRIQMMKNPRAGESLRYLDTFYKMGVRMNCQIVLCRGVNDGEVLRRSIEDLSKYFPVIESVSVVPAGLTSHREGLCPLTPFTKEECGEVIDLIESYSEGFLKKYGERTVYPSDEFFITAGREIPDTEYYGSFYQLENGVGTVRLFSDEFDSVFENAEGVKYKSGTLVTGRLFYPFLSEKAEKINRRFGTALRVVGVRNDFFGENITVAGLLTGKDIINQLRSDGTKGPLFLTECMLKKDTDILLDDVSVKDICRALHRRAVITGSGGKDTAEALLKVRRK